MRRRFQSLRARLLLAMIVPALLAIGVAYVLYTVINQGAEQSSDQQGAQDVAAGLAQVVASGGGIPDSRVLHAALPDAQIVIVMDGRTVLTGPLPDDAEKRQLELAATSSFSRGSVTVYDYTSSRDVVLFQLILAAAAPALLLVISAFAATSYLTRTLRRQIQHASSAAERVAAGDLTARMGAASAGEFLPLATAFDGMAGRLDASDRTQREFLSDLVHELATPISAISGTGLALADGTASTDQDRGEAAETLTHETRRLQALLADLRNLTSLDLVRHVDHQALRIDVLCRDIVARHTPSARAAGVQLSLMASTVTAVSDERLIAMVVDNFVSNAIRYTPAGGRVRVEARRRRNEAIIAVHDTGIGIDDAHRERIFDRFYRVDAARQRATGGSGLGLALARRATKELGGRIELSTKPGEGSTFRLVVPLKPQLSEVTMHTA